MDHSVSKDVLPLIASQMGITSSVRLLLTCKTFMELLGSDEFWRAMIKCRFGASDTIIKTIRQPSLMYIRLYYSDIARCDEMASDYYKFCDVSLIAYYQAIGLAKVDYHSPRLDGYTSMLETILPWAFWYSSEAHLAKVFEAIKPEKHKWDVTAIDALAVPADRRKVIKNVITKYSKMDPGYAARDLGDSLSNLKLNLSSYLSRAHIFPTVLDLAWKLDLFSYLSRAHIFPNSWLIALEIQDGVEKLGSWAICRPPLTGMSQLFTDKGVDFFIQHNN